MTGPPAQLFQDQQVERALQQFDAILVAGAGMGIASLSPSIEDVYTLQLRRGPGAATPGWLSQILVAA